MNYTGDISIRLKQITSRTPLHLIKCLMTISGTDLFNTGDMKSTPSIYKGILGLNVNSRVTE